MPESYPTRPSARRPFVVTPYVLVADGNLVPELPDRCPRAETTTGSRCRISAHHYRKRKTGPGFPLMVARCGEHGCAFTLYPPGYAPYRRQAVVRVGPDGAGMDDDEPETLERKFESTLFEAAVDASGGHAWAREPVDGLSEQWWSTQGRHLSLASRIVGVARDLSDRVREAVAAALPVDTLSLRELAHSVGYRARGRSVCTVLRRLHSAAVAAVRLLRCGHLIGHWGEPLHWDPKRHVLERDPFPLASTAGDS
jgi:hypothetical protein